MDDESADGHRLHRMHGDGDSDMADAGRRAKQDHDSFATAYSRRQLFANAHRGLACQLVAVDRRAIYVMAEGERNFLAS
jgi:hypothetical protein